jgi:ribosomal protein L29
MAKEINKMEVQELRDLIADSQEALRKERFNLAGAGSKDAKKISNLKKTIARALTELKARDTK